MPSLRIMTAVAALVAATAPAAAQDWPTRPVTMVVAYAAGGPVDTIGFRSTAVRAFARCCRIHPK